MNVFLNYTIYTSYALLSNFATTMAHIKPTRQKPTEVNNGGPRL